MLSVSYAIVLLPVPEMTYTVSGGTLNPTHSLIHSYAGMRNSRKLVYDKQQLDYEFVA